MKKDILAVSALIVAVIILIMGTDFQSVKEYYITHIDDIKQDSETVFLSVDCKTVLDNYDMLDESLKNSDYIPDDGVILEKTECVLRENDTVFDVLERCVRKNKIQFEYQGAKENNFGSAYIQGINHLYEFSCGELSGWMYRVNGEFPQYGISKYKLKDGDFIEIIYTCNLGHDVGCRFEKGEEK